MSGFSGSLRSRLTLSLVVGSGALLALGGVFLQGAIASRLIHEFDQGLIAKARSLGLLTEEEGGRLWVEFTDEAMPEFGRPKDPEFFAVWGGDGRLLRRSLSLGTGNLARRPVSTHGAELWDAPLPGGRSGRYVQLAFHPQIEEEEGAESGSGFPLIRIDPKGPAATIVVARSRVELDRFLSQLRLLFALWGLGLLAGLAGLIRLSLGLGLAPVERLNRRLEGLDAGSLGERIDSSGVPAELAPMVERLNDLLGRLETSFAREKAISSHLAHELRTPLAELRAATEVGLRWPDDPASVAASLEDARAIGLHMERIAENLLALARSESAQEAPVEEEVPLRAAIEEAWRPLARVAAERRIELKNEVPAGLSVPTDRAKLGLILANLFDNAVVHGTPGGWVACRALPSNNGSGAKVAPGLEVSNPAADLSCDDLPHLFDRFWQKDPSRSGPHAGLGLPLVASLGRSLGLAVAAQLVAGDLRIRLTKA